MKATKAESELLSDGTAVEQGPDLDFGDESLETNLTYRHVSFRLDGYSEGKANQHYCTLE